MYQMSDTSELMVNDERVLIRRRDATLGDNTVVVDGVRLHRGFAAEFALYCNIQPVSGKERMDFPEGERFDEQYWCYIDDSQAQTQADDLIYRPVDNLWYIVRDAESWGSFAKLRIQQQDVGVITPEGHDPLAEFDRQLFVSKRSIG